MRHRLVETDMTNEKVEHCIVGVAVNACLRNFGIKRNASASGTTSTEYNR